SGRSDRPALLARLVGQQQRHARRVLPVGSLRRGLEEFRIRLHPLALAVTPLHMRELVLQRISGLDVAYAAVHARDIRGDALVTAAADARWPRDRRAFTHLLPELAADLGEEVGEHESSSRTVRAVYGGNPLRRQLQIRVQSLDGRIVPGRDLAQEDIGQDLIGQTQLAWLHALNIDYRHHPAHDHGPLHQTGLFQLLGGQRCIGSAEHYGASFDLTNTAAGT